MSFCYLQNKVGPFARSYQPVLNCNKLPIKTLYNVHQKKYLLCASQSHSVGARRNCDVINTKDLCIEKKIDTPQIPTLFACEILESDHKQVCQ